MSGRLLVAILLIGAAWWGLMLLPLCLTPSILLLIPGYGLVYGYFRMFWNFYDWTFSQRITLWLVSLVVHAAWLGTLGWEFMTKFELFTESPAVLCWFMAVLLSLMGLLGDVLIWREEEVWRAEATEVAIHDFH